MIGQKGGKKEKKGGGIYCSEGSQAPPARPLNVGWRSSGMNGSKNAVWLGSGLLMYQQKKKNRHCNRTCVRGQQYDETVTTLEGNLKLCLRNMQFKTALDPKWASALRRTNTAEKLDRSVWWQNLLTGGSTHMTTAALQDRGRCCTVHSCLWLFLARTTDGRPVEGTVLNTQRITANGRGLTGSREIPYCLFVWLSVLYC
jgi:hypothetical protein